MGAVSFKNYALKLLIIGLASFESLTKVVDLEKEG